jgi:hypothetical protein
VQRGAHQDEAQVGHLGQQGSQQDEHEIGVFVTLMDLVDDDVSHALQGVPLGQHPQENAVGAKHEGRGRTPTAGTKVMSMSTFVCLCRPSELMDHMIGRLNGLVKL